MNNLKHYINEKLTIGSQTKIDKHTLHPRIRKMLRLIIYQRIRDNGPNVDLNDIDVSQITNMSRLFKGLEFNGDISKWNVSNVKDMSFMFFNSKFNGNISKWDVSNVENMQGMFENSNFTSKNGDISNWDVSKVKDMTYMFDNCPLQNNPPKWFKNK